LIAYSDTQKGRTPAAKRVVVDEISKDVVWWGDSDNVKKSPNMPITQGGYEMNLHRVISYLNSVPKLFVVDGYATWDQRYKITVRVICTKSYHALFMRNMMIRPTAEEIEKDFKNGGDWTILNAGEFPADMAVESVRHR
jgi:phosphoenolpyruvate carboxykinase (ATP)